MPLFLVADMLDEGLYPNHFKVVEASSRLAVAESMLRDPYRWQDFFRFTNFWDEVRDGVWSAERLLREIDATYVDGDSCAKVVVHEINQIEQTQVPDPYEKGVVERRMTLASSLYYDLYLPPGLKEKPLIIALHGYGGDKSSMMRLMQRILGERQDEFAIACLQGPHQHLVMPTAESPKLGYGFGWLSNFKPEESVALHHEAIRHLIQTLTDARRIDPKRIFLVGFSQAVGANFRFAFTHSALIRGVVGICGGIPGDWSTEGKYESGKIDVLYIAAERDEFFTPERIRQNSDALKTRARSFELQLFDAKHEVPRDSYPTIAAWLKNQINT